MGAIEIFIYIYFGVGAEHFGLWTGMHVCVHHVCVGKRYTRGSEHEESFRKEASASESQSFWKNNWHPRGWCIDCRFVWRIRFDALRYLLRWHDKEPRSKQFSAVIFESFFVSVWHIYMAQRDAAETRRDRVQHPKSLLCDAAIRST